MKKWLMALAGLTMALATAGAVAAFTLGGDATHGQERVQKADWRVVEAVGWPGGFSLSLPPSWELKEVQGIDSYVGEIVGDGVLLHFDFGWYSNPLADDDDPLHIVVYEDIGGRRAKLVRPKVEMEGYVGVYFENIGGVDGDLPPNRLQISGEGLTAEQLETAFAIFRSIRKLDS